MNKLYFLNRHYELKATLKGKNQEIKRLKKKLRLTNDFHKSLLGEHHKLEIELQNKLSNAQEIINKYQSKKWYKFL
jgi:hypothetical protein